MANPQVPDPQYAKLSVVENDDNLCKAIEEVLGRDGPQRVLLAGEAGIGKTRLAKKVGEHAIKLGFSFLTICVHLNQKFDDEWSLYENIASQLSVYSDFEETEVDDRDEDDEEEKKELKDLLADLKKNITDEIEKRKDVAKKKAKEAKVFAEKKSKEAKVFAEKKGKEAKKQLSCGKNQTGDGKDKPNVDETKPAEGEPYLLLILDDEGNMASEDKVMKELNLEKFLSEQNFLKSNKNGLKILVTRRKGDEEPSKPAEDIVSKDTKSEHGSGSHTTEDQEEEDNDSKNEPDEEIKPDNEGETEPATTENAQVTEPGAESAPATGDEEPSKTKDTKSEQGDGSHTTVDQDKEDKSKNESAGEIKPEDTDNTQVTESGGGSAQVTGATKCYDVITFQTTDTSQLLLESINEVFLMNLFLSIVTDEWKSDNKLISDVVKRSRKSPAAIVVLANSLKQITEKESREKKLKVQELKEKIQVILSADRFAPLESRSSSENRGDKDGVPPDNSETSDQGSTTESAINPILHLAYELLEHSLLCKKVILDCFWHSLDFFEHCGCVYYRDLITQWILEGYFDPVRTVEKAYQYGHSIVMELINRGMLKIQENNVVVPEMAMSNLIDPRRRGHLGRSQLAFSRVYAGDKKKGIGKINQIDDMIKTVQAKKGDKISTLLVSGDRLRRETPEKYFKKLGDLEVLGLFEPTLEPFVPCFINLHKLRVLVIRDCDLLTDIEELKALRGLNALEVSGASSLKKISDDFFKALSKLQSLHLSGLQITSSPSSISELTELHCLIIRDCPLLEDLPDIQELVKLEVVDVSGARGLQTCFDNTKGEKKNKSKNKNFYHLTKLQLLDFSESQIERLPIFQDSAVAAKLHSLTRLLLRNCSQLRRLPSLKPLSGLQILDLSGTTSLVEMLEVCFEDKKELRTLNLTGTSLSELATTIDELSNLRELLLKDCTNLEEIPTIQKLTNLEVIDVSGCIKLQEIKGSFVDMHYIREVNLFGTKLTITPEFLPKESKIRGRKYIILADGTRIEGKNWDDIKKAMPMKESEEASSSREAVETQEISEKESKEVGETQPKKSDKASSSGEVADTQEKVSEEKGEIQTIESRTTDCIEKEVVSKERLHHVPVERGIYKTILSHLDTASQQEVMKLHGSKEAVADAEIVSFVDISSTRLTSIFNETKTVKSCSLWMCMDIKDLFSGVKEECLGSLETLSITNLPLLETICWGGSCKNLKKLSIECCPNIKTIFSEASQLPGSLKELHIMYCEKLEKVFKEEGEVPTLTTLRLVDLPVLSAVGAKLPNLEKLDPRKCPKLKGEEEHPSISEWVVVDESEVPPPQA